MLFGNLKAEPMHCDVLVNEQQHRPASDLMCVGISLLGEVSFMQMKLLSFV
jgi:hypothetical protein